MSDFVKKLPSPVSVPEGDAREIAVKIVADTLRFAATEPDNDACTNHVVNMLTAALLSAESRARREGREEMREQAAQIADAYAEVNIEAAGDTLLADPVLRGGPLTAANIAKAESLQIDGCVHSSMFHAAQNIACAIRKLPLSSPEEG